MTPPAHAAETAPVLSVSVPSPGFSKKKKELPLLPLTWQCHVRRVQHEDRPALDRPQRIVAGLEPQSGEQLRSRQQLGRPGEPGGGLGWIHGRLDTNAAAPSPVFSPANAVVANDVVHRRLGAVQDRGDLVHVLQGLVLQGGQTRNGVCQVPVGRWSPSSSHRQTHQGSLPVDNVAEVEDQIDLLPAKVRKRLPRLPQRLTKPLATFFNVRVILESGRRSRK